MKWKTFIYDKKLAVQFFITLIVLIILLYFFPKFLAGVELREGVTLPDPFLAAFKAIDLTWLTFSLIYLSLIIALITFIPNPVTLMKALQCYSLMLLIRSLVMYVTPFNAPAGIILLNDPFVQFFGSGRILTKDLFFSGHTATLFLLFLLSGNKVLKIIFLMSTFIVGIAVLLQHVHYSVDVIAAPFFAYGCFRFVILLFERLNKNLSKV